MLQVGEGLWILQEEEQQRQIEQEKTEPQEGLMFTKQKQRRAFYSSILNTDRNKCLSYGWHQRFSSSEGVTSVCSNVYTHTHVYVLDSACQAQLHIVRLSSR